MTISYDVKFLNLFDTVYYDYNAVYILTTRINK